MKKRIDKELFFDIQFSSRLLDTVSCPMHLHSCIEIIIVSSGTMHMALGEQNYMINAGSAMYIEPYEAHKFFDDHPNQSYIVEFMLESDLKFWEFIQNNSVENRQITLSEETFRYLKAKLPLNNQRQIDAHSEPAFVQAILAPLCYEFISKCRTKKQNPTNSNTYVNTLKLISRMIWQDPQQKISLESVASQLGIHKTTLSKLLSESSNMSFTDIVQYMRVRKASTMLRQNMSISAVSDFAGFNCIRSFNRAFKKVTGYTPTEYLKSTDDIADRYNIFIGIE